MLLSGKTALPQRGFTLIELLIVMTLIGVASLLAVSGLDRFALRARDASWTDKVRTELVRVRNKAVLSGTPMQLNVMFATGELRVLGESGRKPLQLPGSFAFLPAGVAEGFVDVAAVPSVPLSFLPDGTAAEARFLLRDGDGRLQLFHIRGLTGRITVEPVAPGADLGLQPTLAPFAGALVNTLIDTPAPAAGTPPAAPAPGTPPPASAGAPR